MAGLFDDIVSSDAPPQDGNVFSDIVETPKPKGLLATVGDTFKGAGARMAQGVNESLGSIDRAFGMDDGAKMYQENAEYWNQKAEEAGSNGLAAKIYTGIGEAPAGVAEFMGNVPYAAAKGAVEGYREDGLTGAVSKGALEGVKRLGIGKVFHGIENTGISGMTKASAMGSTMGAQTAAEQYGATGTINPEDVAASTATGAFLSLDGGGKAAEVKRNLLREGVQTDIAQDLSSRTPMTLATARKRLQKSKVEIPDTGITDDSVSVDQAIASANAAVDWTHDERNRLLKELGGEVEEPAKPSLDIGMGGEAVSANFLDPAMIKAVEQRRGAPLKGELTPEELRAQDISAAMDGPVLSRDALEEVEANKTDPVLAAAMADGRTRQFDLGESGPLETLTGYRPDFVMKKEGMIEPEVIPPEAPKTVPETEQLALPAPEEVKQLPYRGEAAKVPETKEIADAQIPPVDGLSEPVDTQVSPEKAAMESYKGADNVREQIARIAGERVANDIYEKADQRLIDTEGPARSELMGPGGRGKVFYDAMQKELSSHLAELQLQAKDPNSLLSRQLDKKHTAYVQGFEELLHRSDREEANALADTLEKKRVSSEHQQRIIDAMDSGNNDAVLDAMNEAVANSPDKLRLAPSPKVEAPAPVGEKVEPAAKETAPAPVDTTSATRNVLQQLASPKRKSDTLVSSLKDAHGKELLNQLVKQEMVRFPGQGRAEITKVGREWLDKNPPERTAKQQERYNILSRKKNLTDKDRATLAELEGKPEAKEPAKVEPVAQPAQEEKAPEPVALKTEVSTAKIEDFGEKIGGAKKDRQPSMEKDFSDDDIVKLPLSEIWPKKELDGIEDVPLAALATAARGEIPAKPKTGYKVGRWAEKVKAVRGLVKKAQEMGVNEMYQKMGDYSALVSRFIPKAKLLESIGRDQWGRIGSVEEYPHAYRYSGTERTPTPHSIVEIDGRREQFNVGSVADALPEIEARLGVEAVGKKMVFEVRGRGNDWNINKKGDPLYRPLKGFDNSKDALNFVRSNHADLVKEWDSLKERENVKERDLRTDENRPRSGADHRKGKDVTPEHFQDAFGFRGVEFGNWVGQGSAKAERQGMLNHAFDAMMDLSKILGVPPKAMSLNGTMGIGFGSRGSGWASAHFEPSNLAINLTKTRGAGAFAHEWFHALDNYFARQRGGEKTFTGDNAKYRQENYITSMPEPMYVRKDGRMSGPPISEARLEQYRKGNPNSGYFNPENWHVDPNHPQGVRPEMEARWADLVKALDESPMAARSRLIDKGKSDGYWSRTLERAARAFENYALFKMQKEGYHNDYLANVVNENDFRRDVGRYPYLLTDEVKPIADALDNLFAEMKTRKTDKGVELYDVTSVPALAAKEVAKLVENIRITKTFQDLRASVHELGAHLYEKGMEFKEFAERMKDAAADQWVRVSAFAKGAYEYAKGKLTEDRGSFSQKPIEPEDKPDLTPISEQFRIVRETADKLNKLADRSKFIKSDVKPTINTAIEGANVAVDGIRRAVNPMARSDAAEAAGRILIEGMGKMAHDVDKFKGELNKALGQYNEQTGLMAKAKDLLTNSTGIIADKVFAALPEKGRYDFMQRMDSGEEQSTPELQAVADTVKKMFDDKVEAVQKLGTGALDNARDSYFPHIWERGEDAARQIMAGLSRRPLEGAKSFAKQRVFDDVQAGIDAGYKMVSSNPLDIVFLKMAEMDKYINAHSALQAMEDSGLVQLIPAGEKPHADFSDISGRYGVVTKREAVDTNTGEVNMKSYRYVARDDVAQIFNNYLSQSLYNNKYVGGIYKAYMGAANNLNMFQLGVFSAFHAGFTSHEAVISHASIGMKALSRGDFKTAAKYLGEAPAAWVTNPILGDKIIKAWMGGESPKEMPQIVQWLELAGARRAMDTRFRTNATQKMMEKWGEGNKLGAAVKTIPAIVEQSARPIMEWLVPRQKFGVFGEMANDWVQRHPNATHEELRENMQKIWNRVDSRLGQVVYDRMFLHNVSKNVAQALIRAPGWTGGTILEVGGGTKDLAKYAKDIAFGKKAEMSDRAAYTVSMLAVTGMMNAVLTAAFTGEKPQDWKDLVAFRTGNIDEQGNPERFMLPTYMKDVYAYASDIQSGEPLRTIGHKTHPLLSLMGDIKKNRDYYGVEIRHEGDNPVHQGAQLAGYVAKAFVPFWVKGLQKERERGGSTLAQTAPFIGVMPAPSDMNKSKAEKLAQKLMVERMPNNAKTKEDFERNQTMKKLTNALRKGEGDANDKIRQAVHDGVITVKQAHNIRVNAKLDPLEVAFKRLGYEEAQKVMESASDEEKEQLKRLFKKKERNYKLSHPRNKTED